MKNLKKILLGTLAVTALSATCAVYAACQVDSGIVNRFVVDETQTLQKSGEAGSNVEFPEVTKEGYIFKGWYTNSEFIGMPVTSATYESEVTYYARWAKGYEVVFDLDGGTLENVSKVYLEEGASIANAVQNYTPSYGDYQFGGWYVGDEPLAANERMTTAGITLTARYKAEYSVDVYLQSLDNADVYVKSESFTTGYALIGEDYAPEVTVKGYSVTSHENEVTDKEISGTKSQNVFSLYFDRNNYTLTLSANYPDGTFDSVSRSYLYEKEFTLPENTFAADGCRFLGWAVSPSAGYEDIITEATYKLTDDEVLYAVWNVGLVDMFSGEDRIFVDPADSKKITLCRGGIDIPGEYDERRDVYTLNGEQIKINVKLRDDGKFVYLSNRQGSYVLFTGRGTLDRSVNLVFDDYDGCDLNTNGTVINQKRGTYSVDENGEYTATVKDILTQEESVVYFKLGLAYDSDGRLIRVFRMRGEESSYGDVPRYMAGNAYYPILNFDGYGNVDYITPNNRRATYNYTIQDGIVNVYTTQNMQRVTVVIARLGNINGQPVYELYDSALDKEYRHADNSNITIKLNGSSTIIYTDGDNSYTGNYTDIVALNNGCHIIAAEEADGTPHTYLLNGVVFTEEQNVAGVYLLYNDNGRLGVPVLIVKTSETAVAEAAIYGIDNTNFWGLISKGSITQNNSSFTYVVDGDIAEWYTDKYSEITLVLGGVSTNGGSYPVYFLLSAKEKVAGGEDIEHSFSTLYVGEDGSKLTLTQSFAVYEIAGENPTVLLGSYTTSASLGYTTVTIGNNKYYFMLTKATEEGADNTFELLDNAPLVIYWLMGNIPNMRVSVTLTGRTVGDKQEAISTADVPYYGTVESIQVNVFNSNMFVYKFEGTSADGKTDSFYFVISAISGGYYYTRYSTAEDIVLGTFLEIDETGGVVENSTIRITADDKFTYIKDNKRTVGTWTSEEKYVFDSVPVIIYTFTPDNPESEVKSFIFTLRQTDDGIYFLIKGVNSTLTAADGSTLELDGESHVGRYTDKDGVQYENYYWLTDNVLGADKPAYMMIINEEFRFFDIDGETFSLRGLEQASYFAIKNGSYSLAGVTFKFDGYGNVTATILGATEDADEIVSGTYKNNNGVYTVTLEGGKTYVGLLGSYDIPVENNKTLTVNAFYIEEEGYEGSYINKENLTVLVLDSIGNAIRYGSYGIRERGTYVILDDGLIYYVNENSTSAAVYTIEGNEIIVESRVATYYADDLSAAVFNGAGNLVYGNSVSLYVFNEDGTEFTTYTRSNEDANEFGFAAAKYSVTNGKFTFNGKTYTYFDGRQITLTAADGSTLSFTPNGSATFSAAAVYTPAGAEEGENCFVITWYGSNGEMRVTLSRENTPLKINGSVNSFDFTYEYLLDVNLGASSFAIKEDEVTIGLIAYEYDFYAGNSSNESMIFIWAEEKDGETSFSVQGYFSNNAGTRLTFTDGTLSKAGGVINANSTNAVNTFVCEFTGSDKNIYHLYFMLMKVNGGDYVFIPCPLVRVAAMQALDEEGTVFYAEAFVLGSSLLNFEDYEANSPYYPTLKYKGELICATGWAYDDNAEEWKFMAYEYDGTVNGQSRYLYVVSMEFGEDGEFVSASVVKHSLTTFTTADNRFKVLAWTDETGAVYEIFAVAQSSTSYVTECTKNEDGSFNVTVDIGNGLSLYYKITFTTEGEETTVTVERVEAPQQPGSGEEVETPDENPDENQGA